MFHIDEKNEHPSLRMTATGPDNLIATSLFHPGAVHN
jgi:hypothetical protein